MNPTLPKPIKLTFGESIRQAFMRRMYSIKRELQLLLGSRIIQMMLLLPFMYGAYKLGMQFYIEQKSYLYPGHYIIPATPIKDRMKLYVAGVVREILTDAQVEEEGTKFLSKLLTNPETHEAAVILLKNVLQDPRFVEEGKLFGIDLLTNVIRDPKIQEDVKLLVVKTLKEEDVNKETVQLLKYIVS